MSDLFPTQAGSGTNYRVPNIDMLVTVTTAAVSAGDVLPASSSAPINAGVPVSTATATAAQRKAAFCGVALEDGAVGDIIAIRVQGYCKALVKRTSGVPILAGDPLCFGTAKALEGDPPTVNTNRWVGYCLSAVAQATSATASLQNVCLLGTLGHGVQGAGT